MIERNDEFATEGEYRSSNSTLSVGFAMLFVGLALGAVTALLMAPKTGKQMRRTLRRKYEDAREAVEDIQDQASGWIDRGSDWADKAKSRVAPLAKGFRR
jgi:gas vesicle protein